MNDCLVCGSAVPKERYLVHSHHECPLGAIDCDCEHVGPYCSAECCTYPGCRPAECEGQEALTW